jgi:hypothetical protein
LPKRREPLVGNEPELRDACEISTAPVGIGSSDRDMVQRPVERPSAARTAEGDHARVSGGSKVGRWRWTRRRSRRAPRQVRHRRTHGRGSAVNHAGTSCRLPLAAAKRVPACLRFRLRAEMQLHRIFSSIEATSTTVSSTTPQLAHTSASNVPVGEPQKLYCMPSTPSAAGNRNSLARQIRRDPHARHCPVARMVIANPCRVRSSRSSASTVRSSRSIRRSKSFADITAV